MICVVTIQILRIVIIIGEVYIIKYKPTGERLDFNAKWIQNKIDNGYYIFDIGPRGNSVSSSYYNLEVGRTLSYHTFILQIHTICLESE